MQFIFHFQIVAQHERAIDKGILPVRAVKIKGLIADVGVVDGGERVGRIFGCQSNGSISNNFRQNCTAY